MTYLAPDMFDISCLLAPPPDDVVALAGEMETVRRSQLALPARIASAEADAEVSLYRFDDVLGPAFTARNLPRTDTLFRRAYHPMGHFLLQAKDRWRRARPFELDTAIVPTARLLASAVDSRHTDAGNPQGLSRAATVRYSYAYPSGHAAFGALASILLADMVPELRAALFRRGWAYGEARIIGGLHFPSDIEAGRVLATVLMAVLLQEAGFRSDLGTARDELRGVLGLTGS